MKTPIVVISLDTELAWGKHDKDNFSHLTTWHAERTNIRCLLDVFDKYQIPVTWAVVGHLFLDQCDGRHDPGCYPPGWFQHDPASSWREAPLWYAPDMIEMIRGAHTPHDIGLHSFSHILFSQADAATAAAEMEAARSAAARHGLQPTSFVFPREQAGHLDVLARYGIKVVRWPGRGFTDRLPVHRQIKRFARECAFWVPCRRCRVERKGGLILCSTSISMSGWGNLVGWKKRFYQTLKLTKIRFTLALTRIFACSIHLDAHPHNFRSEEDIAFVEKVSTALAKARSKNRIRIRTMADLAR